MSALKHCVILALWILAAPSSAGAQWNGGVIRTAMVPAPSLRGNLIGDSAERRISIYLPPGYRQRPDRRYPVVYLLHGFGADDRAFIKGAYQNLDIRLSMDILIRAGSVRDMIVVTPNARNRYDGSFYANSPAIGDWEDFIARDLIRFVDTHYRTIRRREARGIAGHSMGGFGALRVGMRHPHLFSAVYAMSPYGLSREDQPGPSDKKVWITVLGMRDSVDFRKAGFKANLLTALTAVYASDTTRPPFYVRFPFRVENNVLSLDSAVVARWTPLLSEVAGFAENLRQERIGFDSGDSDGFPEIPVNVRKLDSVLTNLSIPHLFEVYHGTHGNRIKERLETIVLPFFSKTLAGSSPFHQR